MPISSYELVVEQTKLANQRTYLAYMRTGFVVAGIAAAYDKKWVVAFGVFMIFGSIFQYVYINNSLNIHEKLRTEHHDFIPLIYFVLSVGVIAVTVKSKKL